ncbi:hypothetical protein [Microbispora corallina]|nr:hypothetical protein [Microbispora corallina]
MSTPQSPAMAVLLAEFGAYLDHDQADPAADQVGYRQHAVWLTPQERAELIEDMRAAIVSRLANAPAPGRVRHLLSPILFPAEVSGEVSGEMAGGDA